MVFRMEREDDYVTHLLGIMENYFDRHHMPNDRRQSVRMKWSETAHIQAIIDGEWWTMERKDTR
jgi:hypothetical protein